MGCFPDLDRAETVPCLARHNGSAVHDGLPSNAPPPQRANLGRFAWTSLIRPNMTDLPSRPIPSSFLAIASTG